MTETPADVLLIEDNALDVELTLQGFKKHRLAEHVQVVRDGSLALEFIHRTGRFATRPSENPKLIILDLKMPVVDGHYVLRQITSDPETKMIPIVVVTSSREPRDIYSTYKLGINSYVVKPVNSDTYIDMVGNLAKYWLSINQPPTPS
jgi:CheY-like chemotaxis protein